jgi:hypothetical protein
VRRSGFRRYPGCTRRRCQARLLLVLAAGLFWAASAFWAADTFTAAGTARADGIPEADTVGEEATRGPAAASGVPAKDPSGDKLAPETAAKPANPPAREVPDPAARLPKGGSAVEYWDLTMELDSGHHLFVRFAISNEGPGDQLGFATGELTDPEGKVTHFRNGRQKSRWTLSPDRLRLDIGNSHLDLHGPRYRLQVNKSHIEIDLSFSPRAGMAAPAGILPKGYAVDLLALASPTHGTIRLEEMSKGLKVQGRTAALHTVVQKSEPKLMRRRIEMFSQQRDPALYVADFAAPSGKRSYWLRAVDGTSGAEQSERLFSETAFEIELSGALLPPGKQGEKQKKMGDYWLPSRLELSGEAVGGEASLSQGLVQRDPLSDLPQPLRFLAGRISSPRRVWSKANFAVTLSRGSGPTPLRFQNHGVAAINFTNPLTRP